MLTFVEGVPRSAFRKAAETAAAGMPAMGLDGAFGISDLAFQGFGTAGDTLESMRPANLVQVAWKFAVLEDERLAAIVTVRRRNRAMVAGQMEFAHSRPAIVEALRIADEFALQEGVHEIRFVDIPIVDASFLWVTGDRPMFVDRTEPRSLTEDELMDELARRLDRKAAPRPDRTPRPRGSAGPGRG